MKRIVDGVTYNTATSTAVARWVSPSDENEPRSKEHTLYQTRGGAFFIHAYEEWQTKVDGDWIEKSSDKFEPYTAEEAQKWLLTGDVEILNDVFPEPPEATAESATSETIYLRLPKALKTRIERQAKNAGQSVNVWAMRCLETCAGVSAAE